MVSRVGRIGGLVKTVLMEFRDGSISNGMPEFRCDLDQRSEDEEPFVHSGMRKFQNRRRDRDSTHQKKIQIQGPRPVADLIRALTAMLPFDLMKPGQKSLGVEIGFQEKRTIEEGTL
jgi:hypothetical protein